MSLYIRTQKHTPRAFLGVRVLVNPNLYELWDMLSAAIDAHYKVRGESGGYGQQGTDGVMLKGISGHQASGGKVVECGLEHQGGTGASVLRVTRETVEIKDTKDAKQSLGG
ncbi:hypothetical protein CTI12_AA464350 [Artemisia annua]|uniref:Uncharacterized protein n=1 Tax=Artemisia annua TaxID=35608 RepID=A0A2U1LQT7_ARTAN|nr:hypothetical protein CTI12_AA464350 [Artemisia annua]